MRNTDWLSVKQVFQDAFMRPTGLRAAYVAAACGDDATLRHQVELLLASHKDAKTFLEGPAEAELEDLTTHHLEGQRIGQYKLVREIGAGGREAPAVFGTRMIPDVNRLGCMTAWGSGMTPRV